jgi:PAS domain S-box-containing protein
METQSEENFTSRIEDLENRLAEAEQLIEAIKAGEVDAFALNKNNQPEIYTLQSGDYAYRVLVENFSEGALNLSEDGLIVYTNSSFYQMLGLSYEQVIGKNIFQFIHPSAKEIFDELFKSGIAGQSKGEINLVAGKKPFPVYVSLTSLYPTLPTVGMIVSDLSEKKAQEKIVKQSEEKFNKLFLASPLGLVLSEIPSGKIVDANEVYFETIGYSREECIGKSSLDLGLVEVNARQKILEPLNKNGSVKNVEVEITTKNGNKLPVLNSIEKINIGDKEYFLSAIIDIVDRKNSEKQIEEKNSELQKMNKELEAFTYISSHDLQEPLRKIQTFAGRIIEEEKEKLSESGVDYFNRMQDAAARLQVLIQDLLHFSRLATTERKFEITDLNKIIDQVVVEFKEAIEAKKAIIERGELGKINIIPFQFNQLMHNLISNALKFSKHNVSPLITIKSKVATGKEFNEEKILPEKKYCCLTVTDNGIGFEEHFFEKIFEVFQKLHSKDEFPGTGIGLAIVKKIVENHHGVIRAISQPGIGTRFDIYFPA